MTPNRQVTALILVLEPVLRRPMAKAVALRYGVGPRTARLMTAGAFRWLGAVQAVRRVRARVAAPLRSRRRR